MSFSHKIMSARYCLPGETDWHQIVDRVTKIFDIVRAPSSLRTSFRYFMLSKKFIPGGRILRNAGLPSPQLSNCFLFSAEDTREGWGELAKKATIALMTGGGVGVDYSALRAKGRPLKSTGGVASGPLPLIRSINEIGRGVQCGGFRRSALYASLPWDHADILDFIRLKDWPSWLRGQKALDMDVAAPGDMTNISVRLDRGFFSAFSDAENIRHDLAVSVYNTAVRRMLKTGEPGFQVDFDNQTLRNA